MSVGSLLPVFCALASCAVLMTGCGRSPDPVEAGSSGSQARLVMTGSSTVAPLAAEIAKRFESEHPGVRVDVQATLVRVVEHALDKAFSPIHR